MIGNHRDTLYPAYLLRHQAYRNTSALLSFYTPNQGRVSLVARGVRQARSASRPLLQPFRPLLIAWHIKGELGSLRAVEADGLACPLPANRIASGFYVNELIERLVPRYDPSPTLYAAYVQTLHGLTDVDVNQQRSLRLFEKTLLDELGYGLVLEYEVEHGQPVLPGQYYTYFLERGPVCHAQATGRGIVLRGESLLSLAAGQLNERESLRDIKILMRAALDQHLGGRPLKSRELFLPISH